MDGLGTNELLVDITHDAVDFIADGENPPASALNLLYHLLSCGFLIPLVGETDFPVGAGTRRVGTTRTYVRLDSRPVGDDGYDRWVQSIKAGRVYFGDGRSHIVGFRVNGQIVGD